MTGFRHEALMYADEDEFLAGTVPFVREGVAIGEPTMVAIGAARMAPLRAALGSDAEAVRFVDIAEIGTNPARIIPAWRDFVAAHRGAVRGIGEPAWPGRSAAELVECERHEVLLNLAFNATDGFRLLCPYDTAGLDPAVTAGARGSHPVVVENGTARRSDAYDGLERAAAPFTEPLPEPLTPPAEGAFDARSLRAVRRFVAGEAVAAGLEAGRAEELVLAVSELAANSVKYGGGTGLLRLWRDDGHVVCEIRDRGRIDDPLTGRRRPVPGRSGGYGLWLVNQLCELVQVRSLPDGSVIRVHKRVTTGPPAGRDGRRW
jgi:anti-sigma regulatory factor (Ser/Thr protein kinase)